LRITYLDDTVDDDHIFFVSYVLNSSESAADDANQGNYRVSKLRAVVVQQEHQKVKLVILFNLEHIVSYKLIH
jgi:hypothetical protein